MRILQVHKYYSKKRGGGSVTAFFEIIKILEKNGHTVSVFSMKDSENEKSEYERYFTKHLDFNEKNNVWEKIKMVGKVIFNREAQKKIEKIIQAEKPEIAHLHNFYHYLSPSIIFSLKKNKIPMIMTLHDYKLICPNYKLFSQGKICENCRGGRYYHCFLKKCVKNSYSFSLVAMLEAYLHKFLKTYEKVDLFIASSKFMKEKCVEFGISPEKIKILKNPFDTKNFGLNKEEENYFLYYGRLSEEKGISDLIKAVAKIHQENFLEKDKLLIVGKGPEEKNLKKLVQKLKMERKISFLGFKQGEDLKKIIASSKFTVLPSVWYDNLPLTILESQLLKKPVIVSDLGGSKELMIENETGFIFQGGNIDDLGEKIKKMLNLNFLEREKMGEKARKNISEVNDEKNLYSQLLKIYKEVINNYKRKEKK